MRTWRRPSGGSKTGRPPRLARPGRRGGTVSRTPVSTSPELERAILVGVAQKRRAALWSLEDSLEELAQLARGAGATVLASVTQRLDHLTSNYLGRGKLQELKELGHRLGYTLAVFDDELTLAQQRNLEEALGVKIIDRTALILDTFARHARTREGRLQVELAQHQYLLPRLAGQWSHLERLGGGIGTRGPGETQLETDRRLVRRRIQHLKAELEDVRRRRSLHRRQRRRFGVPTVSLVGYTNAGKSTLFNALAREEVVAVEDRSFSTLDPVTRSVSVHDGRQVLLTDTVGFIQKLPAALVAAFRATLEELQDADLLLEVVDISHPNASEQAQVVEETLGELELAGKPRVLVLNKVDRMMNWDSAFPDGLGDGLTAAQIPSVLISAEKGWGMDRLLQAVEEGLSASKAAGAGVS